MKEINPVILAILVAIGVMLIAGYRQLIRYKQKMELK
jgi:hypothetical protein